jgi:methionyl-tRNA formyltransferase
MAGDRESGVTIMKMEEGLDTGPIAMAERVPIDADATAGDLSDRLARLGADLMARTLAAIERGSLALRPQPPAGVIYAGKIGKHETRIDWTRSWQQAHDHIRALSPAPGAWFEFSAGAGTHARIKVLRSTRGEGSGPAGTVLDGRLTVACGQGAVRILALQRAGREALNAEAFLRGTPVAAGTRLR